MRYSISVCCMMTRCCELGEYADYFIEKVWGILDSQDIYREESAKDYVKVCEDGENVIAIGAAMYYINQAAVRL